MFGIEPEKVGEILNFASKLIDEGKIKSIATKSGVYSLRNVKDGFKTLESG